jgi:hypothetical protein
MNSIFPASGSDSNSFELVSPLIWRRLHSQARSLPLESQGLERYFQQAQYPQSHHQIALFGLEGVSPLQGDLRLHLHLQNPNLEMV